MSVGLLTREEQQLLSKQIATTALKGDGKKDRFPSKNRPAFAFQQAQMVNHELFAAGHYKMPHAWAKVDDAITHSERPDASSARRARAAPAHVAPSGAARPPLAPP